MFYALVFKLAILRPLGYGGPSGGHLGAILGPSWAALEPSWRSFYHLRSTLPQPREALKIAKKTNRKQAFSLLGPSCGHLAPSKPFLGAPLAPSLDFPRAPWGHLGPSWAILGPSWATLVPLGRIWALLGTFLGPFGVILELRWGHFGATLGPYWEHIWT